MRTTKYLLLSLAALTTILSTISVFAKQVPLFAEPQEKANVVGTVDLAAGIIPIFTPKDSKWVKIADPRNGNVGWVKASDLTSNGSSFSFSTKIMSDDNNPQQTYQVIQFGTDKKNSKEMEAQLKKLQLQQSEIQKSMNKSIQNMVKDMNQLYQQYTNTMNSMGMPIIMPVMLVPVDNKPAGTAKPAQQK